MGNSGKQQILAFFLIMVVLFLTPKYMELISPPQEEVAPKVILEDYTNNEDLGLENNIDINEILTKRKIDIVSNNEVVFTVETPLYIAEISNAGGGSLKSFTLKK